MFLVFISTLFWGFSNITTKKLQKEKISSLNITYIIGLFFLPIFFLINFILGGDYIHIVKFSYLGFIGFIGFILLLKSFNYINLGLAILISNLAIIFASLLNFFILDETISILQFIYLFCILIILLIYYLIHKHKKNKDILKGISLAFITSVLFGIRYFGSNYISKVYMVSPIELKNANYLGGVVFLSILLFFIKNNNVIKDIKTIFNKKLLIYSVMATGIFEFIGDTLLFYLYGIYNGTILTILTLSEIIFAYILGYIFFKEKINKLDLLLLFLLLCLLILFLI